MIIVSQQIHFCKFVFVNFVIAEKGDQFLMSLSLPRYDACLNTGLCRLNMWKLKVWNNKLMPANSSLDVNEEWAVHCSCRHDKLSCPAHSVDMGTLRSIKATLMKSTPKSRPPILSNIFAIFPSSPGQLLKRRGIRLLDTSTQRLRVALNQKLNIKKKNKRKIK